MQRSYMIGLDVGSTTVKAVVTDVVTDRIVWSDYQRHDTKQPEKVLEFLKRFEAEIDGFQAKECRIFVTGSGGNGLAGYLGAKFVQEVNAVSLAVEKLNPECGSVIELGGQDAKIIIFKEDPETGRKKKIPSMNDKCAGGTGAVIDKINAKLRIPADRLSQMGYNGLRLHPVAGKCGVFAETDVNGLQKAGVPPDELMASLFEAIVMQNLSVLTRGNTLRPVVLLLGGPNTYIAGMKECWKHNIPKIWKERSFPLPEGVPPADLIRTPDNAQYFAAIGAIEFGKSEDDCVGCYKGWERLEWYIKHGRAEEKANKGAGGGLAANAEELTDFKRRYRYYKHEPALFAPGQVVEGFIGLDGGSTSTKAVLVSKDASRSVLLKSYALSKGNPIEDTIEILSRLESQASEQGATLRVLGVGTTGYAKDILKDVVGADAAIVETVAHTEAGLHFYKDIDVICDVGGQDIKIIILKNGRVKDFKLNTQCSAGNGYFLQSTAQGFGYPVEQFADVAFGAQSFPSFGYGCAVFMQSDIVDFQRQGWRAEEIMAGLCNVLPKNIWLYVSQIPNLSAIGTRFLLQGGTQYNLAAVKTQVDFIESRFKGKDTRPEVMVHRYCGEAGAIGAALEAGRLYDRGRQTSFIGMEAVREIHYKTTRSEETRCYFCKNNCLRTFIDVKTPLLTAIQPLNSKVPLEAGSQRVIIATCEKGTVEDVDHMRAIKGNIDRIKDANPNFAEIAARAAFRIPDAPKVSDPPARFLLTPAQKKRAALAKRRSEIRIGMPRVLNMYSSAPLFTGYFASLGVRPQNQVFSDFTTEELYKEGAKRGAIDPCFPSKLGIPHIHNLLQTHHAKKPLDYIFFPVIDDLTSDLRCAASHRSCPTVASTPEAVKAAFTKEGDVFKEKGVVYLDTFVNLATPALFERQMYEQFRDIFGLTPEENARAVEQGYKTLADFSRNLRRQAREVLDQLEREDRIGVVMLGRPYHNDPGINHDILEEFQKLGYPVFTQDSLPIDDDILERLFGEEVRAGDIPHALAVTDVWKNSYSENTSRKVWAAKYVARHPNLVALELSNFKCGHDAPIYTVVEEIVEHSGTPYFCFKDIDENKPAGSIKIRVETIAYFLSRYREDLVDARKKQTDIDRQLAEFEARIRREALRKRLQAIDEDERVRQAFAGGHLPTIDVDLATLANSRPAA
jgi:activator of 2-hydroxyglutaryl-CoA dehydratase/predicted nucleotide-binding protein (sugar kinase/HSP70/actin superfamily)